MDTCKDIACLPGSRFCRCPSKEGECDLSVSSSFTHLSPCFLCPRIRNRVTDRPVRGFARDASINNKPKRSTTDGVLHRSQQSRLPAPTASGTGAAHQ